MLYHSCCHVLLFHFCLFIEYDTYNARNTEANNDTSRSISIQSDNRQFVLNGIKKTWGDAVLDCKKNGMTLGEVRTMDEARSLSQKMLKNRPVAIENAWIGGYKNSPKRQSTEWRWLSNNEKIDDDNQLWREHSETENKSDFESPSPNPQCLLLDWHLRTQTNPSYIKASCDRKREFICEKVNRTATGNSKAIITATNHDVMSSVSKVITPDHRSLTTPVPTYSTSTTAKAAQKPSSRIKGKKKRKKKKVKEITTLPPTTTTTTAKIEEEYLDYRMWEFGKAHMRMWKKKIAKDKRRKLTSGTAQIKSESLKRIRFQEPTNDFSTTQKPEVTRSTTKKPLKPLQLYYAFEGPMVGGLTALPMPHKELNGGAINIPARRYHKYISRRKYNQYMARNQIKG